MPCIVRSCRVIAETVRVVGPNLRESAAHAVRPADVALSTCRVTAAASAVVLFFNSRSIEGHTRANFDGVFLAPQVRMKTVGGCSGFPGRLTGHLACTEGARVRDHVDMRLFHRGEGAVGLAVVTALTWPSSRERC